MLESTMQTTGGEVIDGLTQMCTLHSTVLTYSTDLPMACNIDNWFRGDQPLSDWLSDLPNGRQEIFGTVNKVITLEVTGSVCRGYGICCCCFAKCTCHQTVLGIFMFTAIDKLCSQPGSEKLLFTLGKS